MDLKEVMAVNLRRIRHDKRLTQEELAHRSGISARYIGAIERAEMSATVTVLGQVSAALGVDPAELLKKSR
jgi:transcriptional regulator with XRE-family HTH domain